jgi:hypothetical protein
MKHVYFGAKYNEPPSPQWQLVQDGSFFFHQPFG